MSFITITWHKLIHVFSAISEEEKRSIRAKLVLTFEEPVQQIALQIAVLIGKAARLEMTLRLLGRFVRVVF